MFYINFLMNDATLWEVKDCSNQDVYKRQMTTITMEYRMRMRKESQEFL